MILFGYSFLRETSFLLFFQTEYSNAKKLLIFKFYRKIVIWFSNFLIYLTLYNIFKFEKILHYWLLIIAYSIAVMHFAYIAEESISIYKHNIIKETMDTIYSITWKKRMIYLFELAAPQIMQSQWYIFVPWNTIFSSRNMFEVCESFKISLHACLNYYQCMQFERLDKIMRIYLNSFG